MQREGLEVEETQELAVAADPTAAETSEAPSPAPEVSAVPEVADELREDIDRIDPPPLTEYKLHNGQWVTFDRLRTRQFFALLRIVTRPALPALRYFSLDPTRQSMDEFTANLVGLVLVSIPEAEDETIAFLKTMITPRDLANDQLTKDQRTAVLTDFNTYMVNPELDDTVTIVEAIVRREAPDLKALGQRLLQMWNLAAKTGQTKVLEQAQDELRETESSEASPEPST